jgi:hypothetical protein
MKKNQFLFAATMLVAVIFSACKKDIITSPSVNQAKLNSASNSKLVFFPRVGWVPADQVHLIEPENYVTFQNGHYLKLEKGTDRVVQDFGDFGTKKTASVSKARRLNVTDTFSLIKKQAAIPSSNNSNWITFAEWANPSGQGTINYFSTTWTVPSAPTGRDGQLLYIYNGLEDANQFDILQPVLQWGNNILYGGNNWCVTNTYVGPGTPGKGFYAYTMPVTVSPGDVLQGVMNFTGVDINGSYTYTSTFNKIVGGVPTSLNNTLTLKYGVTKWGSPNEGIKNDDSVLSVTVPQLNVAVETLEAYGINGKGYFPPFSNDYPSDNYVAMKGIYITTNKPSTPALSWNAVNLVTNFGQYTTYNNTNNSSPGGEVDIYFHGQAPVITYTTPEVYTVGVAIANLSPTNAGGTPSTYSISPAISPYGLSINSTNGVISGTPTSAILATNFTVTATNSSGSGTAIVNIDINPIPTNIAYDFQVLQGDTNPSYLTLAVNGVNLSGEVETTGYNTTLNINNSVLTNPNSTVVLTIDQGYMPRTATLHTYLTNVHGLISGSTITFTGVNISTKQPSLQIALN